MVEVDEVAVYEGDRPYIFVSYAHADGEVVLPIIKALDAAGYRVWYDEGVEWASEWPENIADHLHGCSRFLAFMSHAAAVSENCGDEIYYALDHRKPMLVAYIDDVDLDQVNRGLKMRLTKRQARRRGAYASDEDFVEELVRSKILEPCLREDFLSRREARRDALGLAHSALSSHSDEAALRDALDALLALPDDCRDERSERYVARLKKQLKLLDEEIRQPETTEEHEQKGSPKEIATGQDDAVVQVTPPEDHPVPPPWWRGPFGIVAVAVAIAAVVLAVMLSPKPDPDPTANTLEGRPGGDLMSDAFEHEAESDDERLAEAEGQFAFGSKVRRSEVNSVTFLSSLPDGRSGGLDVSAAGDGSVLAWFDEVSGGLYDLTVAADGPVRAPADCSKLLAGYSSARSIDLSGLDTSGVTDMGRMFYGCSKITNLDVSGFDTSGVTNMFIMFCGCSKLSSLDVSRFETGRVTSMHAMFYGCSSLESLKLDAKRFDTSSVTSMYAMFCGCSKLASLDVSGFETGIVTNMHAMFENCSSLESLDVSGFKTGKVTDMRSMFCGCSSLESLKLDAKHFNTSGVTDMYAMFYNCSKLASLDVSNFKTSAVTDMSWAFGKCVALKALDLTKWDVSKAEKFENMFQGATDSLEVRYPKGDESWKALLQRDDLGGSPHFVATKAK